MKQQEVWNNIAPEWNKFRIKPLEEVQEFLKNKKGKILDLGCGTGRNFTKIKGIIYGVDFSSEMIKFAKINAEKKHIKTEFFVSSLEHLSFKNNFFDSAIFIATLHCIPKSEDRKKSLKELLRVLKPNAEALISVWDKDQVRFKDSEKEISIPWKNNEKEYLRYYYLYDKQEFIDLLKRVGFEIIKTLDKNNSEGFNSKKNIIGVVKKPKN